MPKSKPPLTDFSRRVIAAIQAIPEGKVATYGQIAAIAGKPQGARGVSWLLHSSTRKHKLPWFRVVGSGGKISIPEGTAGFFRQKKFLEQEGIVFSMENKTDLKKFQWARGLKKPLKKKTPTKR